MGIYTKEQQLELIEKHWINLEEIDNQYEEVCLEAVKQIPFALEYLKVIKNTMYRIIDMGLNKCGRRFTFATHVENKLGALSEFTSILANLNANILNTHMSKINSKYGIEKQLVEITIETFNEEHKLEVIKVLENSGFELSYIEN